MRRRDFMKAIAGLPWMMWPLAAQAQHSAVPLVGWLHSGTEKANSERAVPFRQGLAEAGFAEGKDVTIEYRWAENQLDRLPALVADLIQRRVAVITACGNPAAAVAAKSATASIPIVFQNGADPVQVRLVQSFNHPGGNVTGFTNFSADLAAKRMGVLRELAPSAKSIAALVNPTRPGTDALIAQVRDAASAIGLPVQILKAASEREIDAAFSALVQSGAGGLVMTADVVFNDRREQIVALARRYAVPTIYEWRSFVDAGGLVSYGPDIFATYRQVGALVGRILRGEKPGDLPVMRPTRFELVINMKTAKELGIQVPSSMPLLADEVIE
ncbi:MAG: ABC transporter substrate-binding protein [Bradyrhizobium sp.]|nr:ABC transporter substrate-binding protein [Bradyrhizobium sp.]